LFAFSFLLVIVAVTAQQLLRTTPIFYYSNSYIVDDGVHAIIIDTGINITHANLIVTTLSRAPLNLLTVTGIFITHGHPDHYSGLAFLPSTFNGVPVWVANNEIKKQLLENIRFLNASLPSNVTTFPYVTRVLPLPGPNLPGLNVNLTVITSFKPAETHSFGLVLNPNPAQTILYSGDLLYKNVHAYFGPTLDASRVQKWIDDIGLLSTSFPKGINLIYPGHGGAPFVSIAEVLTFQFYLQRFLGLVNDCVPPAQLPAQMIHLFPRYNSTQSFLNFILQNPAWPTYQSVACNTNATRAELCGLLPNRAQCFHARPLCLWRRGSTTGRRRARPNFGSCLPSLRPLKPSQPFGF